MGNILNMAIGVLLKRIPWLLEVVAKNFDKIPLLAKLKGYRSAIGLTLLAALYGANAFFPLDATLFDTLNGILMTFTGLALNASGR